MARKAQADPNRARLIKAVQTGRGKLGLDEDTWRATVARFSETDNPSVREMDVHELERLLRHLRDAGFVGRKPAAAKPEPRRLDMAREAQKARALWLWLAEVGIVRDPSEAALAAFAKRISGVDALQWTVRADKVIEGIKAFGARELQPRIEARLAELRAAGVDLGNLHYDSCDAVLGAHVDGWQVARWLRPTWSPVGFPARQAVWEYLHSDAVTPDTEGAAAQ